MSTGVSWGGKGPTAPTADPTLITQAQGYLREGETLGSLFVNPTPEGKVFLQGLSPRARAALENSARGK